MSHYALCSVYTLLYLCITVNHIFRLKYIFIAEYKCLHHPWLKGYYLVFFISKSKDHFNYRRSQHTLHLVAFRLHWSVPSSTLWTVSIGTLHKHGGVIILLLQVWPKCKDRPFLGSSETLELQQAEGWHPLKHHGTVCVSVVEGIPQLHNVLWTGETGRSRLGQTTTGTDACVIWNLNLLSLIGSLKSRPLQRIELVQCSIPINPTTLLTCCTSHRMKVYE